MKINEVMLYVKDFAKSLEFWTQVLGFKIVEESDLPEGYKKIALKEEDADQTALVLFDRKFIEKYSKEVLDNFPSIMFETRDLEALRERLLERSLHVGEIVDMGPFKVTNFSDFEGNYFAVKEVK